MHFLTALLALAAQDPAPRADLAAWERLDGATFVSRKEVRFGSESEARRFLDTLEGKGTVEKDGDVWKVVVPVALDLAIEFLGRSLDRNERLIGGIHHKPTGRLFLTREEAEAFARENAKVEGVRAETVEGRTLHSANWTDKTDLVGRARERLRNEELADPWVLRPLPGTWTLNRYTYVEKSHGIHPRDAVAYVDMNVEAPPRVDVSIQVHLFKPDAQVEHQVMGRRFNGTWTLRRTDHGTVILEESATGWFLSWKHREGVYVTISGFRPETPDLVGACLKRFPPAWPNDFRIDQNAWVSAEAEFRLRRMKETLEEAPRPGHSWLPYNIEFLELVRWYDTPHLWALSDSQTLEQRREHYAKMLGWWGNVGRESTPRKRPLSPHAVRLMSPPKK